MKFEKKKKLMDVLHGRMKGTEETISEFKDKY